MNQLLARVLVAAVTKTLPRQQAYKLAEKIATRLLAKKTVRLKDDLHELFPDKTEAWIDEMSRRQAAHRAWMTLDKVVLSGMTEDEIVACCDADAFAEMQRVLDEVLAEGRGGIIYTLHYGRPALSPFILASKYPYVGLRARTGMKAFDEPVMKRFEQLGVEIIQAGDIGGGVHIIRALKKNKLLFMIADGKLAQRLTPVDFLGRKVPFGLGFAELARKTGAATIAAIAYSTGPFGFRPVMERVRVPDDVTSLEEMGAILMKPLEAAVLSDIGQWYGINRAFRQARALEGEDDGL